MINRRHHERRQLGDMIWYDLEERRKGDDRRAKQAKQVLTKTKFQALRSRILFHLSVWFAALAMLLFILMYKI